MTDVFSPGIAAPASQHVRVAAVGQSDALMAALVEVFTASGRHVERFTPDALLKKRGSSSSFDVVFVTINSMSLESVLPRLAHVLQGKVVVVCTTPLDSD